MATVANASANDIAFTGFETTGTTGGWECTGSRASAVHALTGNYCYDLSTGNINKSGLTEGKKYTLSYWIYGPGANLTLNVNNTVKKGIVSNGYTCYEQEFTAGPVDLEIKGSGILDNIRLYPVGAQMKTFDYDVFDNVTSVMDENNTIIRYVYDEKQRLLKVADKDWYHLKINEYKD
jgi:YD repeat-containing protein